MEHQRGISRQDLAIFFLLFAGRSLNALAVRTLFQPDEYFQSLEPAWQSAFGEGSGAWITWEWREGLRSSLHPLLFAAVYRTAVQLAKLLSLGAPAQSHLLLAAPKLVQAFFAAMMDFFTYKLAGKICGTRSKAAYAALFLTTVSPWQAFCSVRTLSNSVETTLTVLGLHLWPWNWFAAQSNSATKHTSNKRTSARRPASTDSSLVYLHGSLAAAALACILRPTNIIVWATVSLTMLIRYGDFAKLLMLAQAALVSGGAILAVSISADRLFYEEWVLPPVRFLQFNLVQSLAVFYGKNRSDYYLTEGLPLLLTTALPFAAVGLWHSLRGQEQERNAKAIRFTLATTVLTTVLSLSLISHKEVRFVYPLLPMLHVLAAEPVEAFFAPFPWSKGYVKRTLLCVLLGINILIGWYTLFFHQRGVIDVLHFLRGQHETTTTLSGTDGNDTVAFLMPCHSTPWRSHMIYSGIDAWALTCNPPLNMSMAQRETYMDEADVFYDHPEAWLAENMASDEPHSRPWPKYLVFFEQLEQDLVHAFHNIKADEYEEAWRGFNTHWHDDWRRQGDVVVWRKVSSNTN